SHAPATLEAELGDLAGLLPAVAAVQPAVRRASGRLVDAVPGAGHHPGADAGDDLPGDAAGHPAADALAAAPAAGRRAPSPGGAPLMDDGVAAIVAPPSSPREPAHVPVPGPHPDHRRQPARRPALRAAPARSRPAGHRHLPQ